MDEPPPIARHEATDRIGKIALRTAHDLGAALAESGSAADEPVLVRTDGPHRTVDGLVALIDAALADEAPAGTAGAASRPAVPDADSRETPSH